MDDVIAAKVYEAIRKQYRASEPLESEDFDDLREDEDSLTGAIAKAVRKTVHGQVGDVWWETRVRKLRGRGPGAEEKRTGADVIIELEIRDADDNIVARKGLLGQAKKEWSGADRKLLDQVRAMEHTARGASIVLDYRRDGCRAALGSAVIAAAGNRRQVADADVRPIGELLADEFLACSVGRRGMYYDASRGRLTVPRLSGIVAPRFAVDARVRTTVFGAPPLRDDDE